MKEQAMRKIYLYSLFERFWHWHQRGHPLFPKAANERFFFCFLDRVIHSDAAIHKLTIF